mmetsp:Transcript_34729/g.97459  ORF Transcript_34729/g.97459 Transcript_34729/m.97459 type:complete len:278 (+) Transcript_34729:1541-2374(+)
MLWTLMKSSPSTWGSAPNATASNSACRASSPLSCIMTFAAESSTNSWKQNTTTSVAVSGDGAHAPRSSDGRTPAACQHGWPWRFQVTTPTPSRPHGARCAFPGPAARSRACSARRSIRASCRASSSKFAQYALFTVLQPISTSERALWPPWRRAEPIVDGVPVYSSDSASPRSAHISRRRTCRGGRAAVATRSPTAPRSRSPKAEGPPGGAGGGDASLVMRPWNSRRPLRHFDSHSHVSWHCTMFVRSRQSKQFVRTTPSCFFLTRPNPDEAATVSR